MEKRAFTLFLMVMILPTSGCSGLFISDVPADKVFLLVPLADGPPGSAQVNLPKLTLNVDIVPGLDTDRLLVLGPHAELNHHATARWQDYLPEVLSSVIRRSLEQAGLFSKVRIGIPGGDDDWTLQLEVREFYSLANSTGQIRNVQATIGATIDCHSHEHSFSLTATKPVSEHNIEAVVRAHQLVVDQIQRELIQELEQVCQG